MKLLWLLLLSFILILSPVSMAQEWSDEIALEQGGTPTTITPDLDIDPSNGHLHIVTMMSPAGVLYTEMDKDGNVLKQSPINYAVEDKNGEGYYFGATIAVDPQGRPHVCYRNYFSGNPPKLSIFYTYWNGSSWTSPVQIANKVMRGWMVRMDIDKNGKTHIAHGSMANNPGEELIGPVTYFRYLQSQQEAVTEDIYRYRADDRLEMDASYQNQVHLVLGCPDYPQEGGPLWYWRSLDNGETWSQFEIHDVDARGANGSPDMFVDASGNVHIVYGSEKDYDTGREPSVRYTRFSNNQHVIDIPVTISGEILDRYDTPQGIASVAASADGQIVIVVYSEDFGGRLFARESHNGGNSWSAPVKLAEESCGSLGRNRHVIRAISDKFYVLYPSPTGVKLRIKKFSNNLPPVADAGGPYSGNEGSAVSFNASASRDPEGVITKYEWDFQNDGVYDATTTSPTTTYTYTDNFTGKIKVRVTDGDSQSSTDEANVTINNVAPTAEAGGPYHGEIGQVINFSGSATDPGADVLSYAWDLDNNGSFETAGQTAQKSFSTGGTHQVQLRVTDDDGGSGTDIAQVSIQNLPPVIVDIPDQTVNEGQSFNAIDLNAAVSDPDNTDDQIVWTFSGNQNLNLRKVSTMLYVEPLNPEWNGGETITFTATDPGGQFDTETARFTINPVNDPPDIVPFTINPINEGEQFPLVFLNATDPDNTANEIRWSTRGQINLMITIDQQANVTTAEIRTPNQDWYGSESVTFIARDQNGNGLTDEYTTTITVNNVNDAPDIRPVLGQTINYTQQFTPVNLDTCVTDVDNPVSQIQWTYSGNNHLGIQINNRIMTITNLNPSWTGSENIIFTASDGKLSDSYTATYTVRYHNDPPVISNIFNETVNENGQFNIIYLDTKVNDPDHADELLRWSITGNISLRIKEIAARVIQIAVPDSEWYGSETLNFQVTDPGNLSANVSATYTVIPINDPPVLQPIPDLSFDEDATLTLSAAELRLLASDPDNQWNELTFSITNNRYTHATFNNQTRNLVLSADANWYGVENVNFVVTDNKFATDFQQIKIIVNAKSDPPAAFDLLFPLTNTGFTIRPPYIDFIWHRAKDTDKNETLTYSLNLSREASFNHIIDQYNALADTFYHFPVPQSYDVGTYYWKVLALDGAGNSASCKNPFLFSLPDIGVKADNDNRVPHEFALYQNHPNPFNPETQLSYQLPRTCHVRLAIYNSLGQLIKTLVDEEQRAGTFYQYWNGRNDKEEPVTSGIYIYKLEADNFVMSKKMLLLQ